MDLDHLEKYRESNRIEAKQAVGGLPSSLWESYSAFANTSGGVILLGVEELKDKSLHPLKLPDPERLVEEFWTIINNRQKVSANILSKNDVQIAEAEGKKIIIIEVPRAGRADRPVFLGMNPFSDSYRRDGDGDYHCTSDEVRSMLRDQVDESKDMRVLENIGADVFDKNTLSEYYGSINGKVSLEGIGLVVDGHPTAAALLMFGREKDIVREFPNYFLDYREYGNDDYVWKYRLSSAGSMRFDGKKTRIGCWSGNLFDFYQRVRKRMETGKNPEAEAVMRAVGNALIHADYNGRRGVIVQIRQRDIRIDNPGGLRMSAEQAINGGTSDPRNVLLMKAFNLAGIGSRSGSGVPMLYREWKKFGYNAPRLHESYEPERTHIIMPLRKSDDKEKQVTIKSDSQKAAIVEFLSENRSGRTTDFADILKVGTTRVKQLLYELVADDVIESCGANRNRTYRLKYFNQGKEK